MLSEKTQIELMQKCREASEMIRTLTGDLQKATVTINQQASTIRQLSQDNLALVAKLDALTGKTAPGTSFAA